MNRFTLASSSGASTSSRTHSGLGRIAEDGDQQRQGRQRFLAAGEEQHVLQPLSGRLRDDIDAAFQDIAVVHQFEIALPAGEEQLECLLEILADRIEGFLELLHGTAVDFQNCLLGVGDRFFDVEALPVQELVALIQFLVLFERAHIDGAEVFDHLAQPVMRLRDILVFPLPFGVRNVGHDLGNGEAELLLAAAFQVFEIAFEPRLFDLDFAAHIHGLFAAAVQLAQLLFKGCQRRALRGEFALFFFQRRGRFLDRAVAVLDPDPHFLLHDLQFRDALQRRGGFRTVDLERGCGRPPVPR